MRPVRHTYHRYPNLGSYLYVAGIQYFLVQILVALRFAPPYSLAHNTISDLGDTACGIFNNRPVCSPFHSLMNISFVVLGISMVAGSILVYQGFVGRRALTIGFWAFGLGGLGVVLVGLFPENTVPAFHGIGAALPFVIGNVGIIVLGFSLNVPTSLRRFTVLSGCVALIALGFYASNRYLDLGEGGIERVVAYPQTIWMIIIGVYGLTHSRPGTPRLRHRTQGIAARS